MTSIFEFRDLISQYDSFMIDLWGVLHDGHTPYAGAIDALHLLRKHGKKIGLLSNSPRRAADASQNIARLGFTPDLYDRIFTSGEMTFESLRDRLDPFLKNIGQTCYVQGNDRDRSLIESLSLHYVHDVGTADFILCSNVNQFGDSVESYDPMLQKALIKKTPMICANPDIEVYHNGALTLCSGAIAKRYETMGGPVLYFGKPDPKVFHRLIKDLGADPKKTLMLGDNMNTDILGATRAGIDVALVVGGIHVTDIGATWGTKPDTHHLQKFLGNFDAKPRYAIPCLRA
jgi:HAD superfamily hydrolase (TIGR01459 family)